MTDSIVVHDEDWLSRVSNHEATQSLGTSHAATTYALARVAMAYHEHMQSQSAWVCVDERLPDEGVKVLVSAIFFANSENTNVEIHACHYSSEHGPFNWRVAEFTGIAKTCVTHWMPLPEPVK